jgi:predicted MPP superfamily phosphohydrolase
MRTATFILTALGIFAVFNAIALWHLLTVHPKRRLLFIIVAIAGNVMWLFLPMLNARTDFSRVVRATLGPPWFAWLCFVLLDSIFVALVVAAWAPFGRRRRLRDFARWPSRAFLALIIIGSAAGFYQAIVPLRVERVPVGIRDLPQELEGTRIALLADLHVGLFTRRSRLEQIFRTTSSLRPNVAIIAGDLIDDDPYFLSKLLAATRAVDSSIPLLAVFGNHEMYGAPHEVIEGLRGTRIRLLVNQGVPLGRAWIAGISDYAAREAALRPDLDAALSSKPADSLPILISHQPKSFDDARRRAIPLTLVAHTHGGQCGFRPLRWSLAGLFLPYHMGLYQRGASQLYVNTGTGFWFLPFRLGMTSEITLVELRRAPR